MSRKYLCPQQSVDMVRQLLRGARPEESPNVVSIDLYRGSRVGCVDDFQEAGEKSCLAGGKIIPLFQVSPLNQKTIK